MLERDLSRRIIGAFFEVYRRLGYGFLERLYANALAIELQHMAISFSREVPIEVLYRGVSVGTYRIDMVVDQRIVVEIKSAKCLTVADERQLLNYPHASRLSRLSREPFWVAARQC